MKRHPLAISFAIVSLLFWIVACALLLEWGERYVTPSGGVDRYASPLIGQAEKRDLEIYEATAATAARPPAEVSAKYPELSALDTANDPAIAGLAEQWEGVIFQCDKEGGILKRHAMSAPGLAALLATKTASVGNISGIPPGERPEFGRDLLSKLQRSVDAWRNPQPRLPHMVGCESPWVDYEVPLPDYPHAGFRFMFHPVPAPEKSDPIIYTVVVPWRWQAVFGGFRHNYYERDAYPQFPQSEFWTNSRGFRDQELTVPKPKGVYRIVCIGGSTTLEGPRNDLSYPKILQQMLREHFQTDAIEVVNCGVDGGTILGQASQFDECLALQPDLVIHYNFVNDASILMDNVLKATIMGTAWRQSVMGAMCKSEFLAHRCRWPRSLVMPKVPDYRAEIERYLMPPLRDLCERAKKSGARFAVASFAVPDIYNLPSNERAWFRNHFWFHQVTEIQLDDFLVAATAFNESVRSFCGREGAIYVPVAEEIKGGLETFTDNWHMHVPGIRRKAEIMFDHLSPIIDQDLSGRKQSEPAQQ